MRAGAIAKRYAQAAFEVAQEQGAVDRWFSDLQQLGAAVSDPVVARWLENTKVTAARKEEVLAGALPRPDPLFANLLKLLIAKDRIALLPDIATMFERFVNQARQITMAEVTTAVPIDAAEEARITRQLATMTGQEVRLTTRIDPSIVGGVVARIGDRVIDGSVRTRLARLRRELTGTST